MISQCPGQDRRHIKAETIICPDCGYSVEMFSDEIKVKCSHCHGLVCKIRLPSCVEWCKSAKECIGEERWRQLFKNK